ncbi:MAG: LysR family transcriptional regulator [Variovorax sp.]|nr:LysR family transcriptional regulator [Variovorax sp.]
MNKFNEIESFVLAVDRGSLAGAAAELGVTPAMLGRRISALESRLGVKLLHRTTRTLMLTPQGSIFLSRCQQVLHDLEHAESVVAEGQHMASGDLHVFAPPSFGRRHVAIHANAFAATHPRVQLTLNLTTDPINLTRDRYDLGIRIGDVVDESLVKVKLAPNRRVVCGTAEYLRRYGTPRSPDDLARHNCLVFNTPTNRGAGWHFRIGGKRLFVRVKGSIGCNDGEVLTHWAMSGVGLAWRSTWEIQRHLESGELVSVLDDYALPEYDIVAVYPQQPHLPAKVRMYIDTLRSIYSEPGYWTTLTPLVD